MRASHKGRLPTRQARLAMPRKELTIEEARDRAAKLEAWGEAIAEDQKLTSRFADAGPSRVVAMWESGQNEKGRPLSKFEIQALGDRWCELFGSLPPSMGTGSPPAAPSEPPPADDTMLRMGDVIRMTGLSKSTIKRHVADDAFPKPTKISPRRNGWPAHKVRAWLSERESGS